MDKRCYIVLATTSALYLCYVSFHMYRLNKLLKARTLPYDKLPGFLYLYTKYWLKVFSRRRNSPPDISPSEAPSEENAYTVHDCRLETPILRSFCNCAGYGWDYPDAEYRDIPMCFPEFLCFKLLLLLYADKNFIPSPKGLIRVRQSLRTLQPVDELKKGPFTVHVRVKGYEETRFGVEVEISLSATASSGNKVWESDMTLLSQTSLQRAAGSLVEDGEEEPGESKQHNDEQEAENEKQVDLHVPWTAGLQFSWFFSVSLLHRLPFLVIKFFRSRWRPASELWMLSVCLAEIEKHNGTEVITAPIKVTVLFRNPLRAPGNATLRFWEKNRNVGENIEKDVHFSMEQHGQSIPYMVGMIYRVASIRIN